MNDYQKYIETLNKEYIENHLIVQERELLIAENNIEKRDVKGYHGREILELLQNADDAYQERINEGNSPKSELEVLIEFKNNILTISNTGTYFDKEGIKAVVQGNNTSKREGGYIGNKGTGFRSVLNWTEKIKIYSGGYNIEFSRDIADSKFDEMRNYTQIQKQLKKLPNLYVPILAVPQTINGIKSKFDTIIQMEIDSEKTSDGFGVLEQIENIDLRLLLFLPNIDRIIIDLEENEASKTIIYERKIEEEEFKKISLYKYINDEEKISEEFYVFNKIVPKAVIEDEDKKDILLSIAIPLLYEEFSSSTLYSFFPLNNTESPFNCVLHASYVLDDHRDNIINSETNERIIKEQLKFLREVAVKFADKKYGDLSLRILTPKKYSTDYYGNWKFTSSFSKFNLEEYYFDLIKESKILETINGDYISITDNPKIFQDKYPKVFVGKKFRNLLKIDENRLENIGSMSMVEDIANKNGIDLKYIEIDLLNIINLEESKWSVEDHVQVFGWWNKNYYNSVPNLLKTQNGEWLGYKDQCYFLVGNIDKGIPSWVNVPTLDRDYQNEIFELANEDDRIIAIREKDKDTHISRLISQNEVYPLVNFSYRDRNNIITTINNSVDSYNKAVDFIKWLWSNYKMESIEWMPPRGTEASPIKYRFPDESRKLEAYAESLFFGESYGNNLASKLFDKTYGMLPASFVFNINPKEEQYFIDFIAKFGVNTFPKIKRINIEPARKYNNMYNKKIMDSDEIGASEGVYIEYELPYINKLEGILNELSTNEVVSWIKNDTILRSYLSNKYYAENAKIMFIGSRQQYYRKYKGQIENYLLYTFNNTKWIDYKGERYSPTEVLWGVNNRTNSRFEEVLPVINMEYLEFIAKTLNCTYTEVLEIIELFDFCDKITDLSSDEFYGLMLRLPNYDFPQSVELSKAIYRIIELPSFSRNFEESDNKRKFFVEGKVLVRINNKLQYQKAKETFLPSTQIIDKRSVPILEKGQRTNNKNFIQVFGCQEYNKSYTIIRESINESSSNGEFQVYFKEFQRFARAYGERNDNIAEIGGRLDISLVDRISIIETEEIKEIEEDYLILRETTSRWYIVVLDDMYNLNLISEQIENIYSNIANTPGFDSSKIGELFRAEKREDREFLIKKEFGTLDVVADVFYNNQIKNNFIETVNRIDSEFSRTMIDIDFKDFYNTNNGEKISNILNKLNKDIDEFASYGFVYPIDLVPYQKKKLENYLRNEKTNYINTIFNQAINNEDLQKKFIDSIDKFTNFKLKKYENSIYFDVIEEVKKHFSFWEIRTELSAEKSYIENYEKLNKENLFSDDIANDREAQRMIYFNKNHEFREWIEKQETIKDKEDKELTKDPYKKLRNLIPVESEFEYSKLGKKKKIGENRKKGSYIEKENQRSRRNKKIAGNKGELLIYNELCNKYGRKHVYPKSEAFVELGILKAGQASSGEYDLSYIDFDGMEHFVEVKVSSGQSFIITPGELNFAKKNPNQFRIYLVSDIDSDNPNYKILPPKFWEDDKFIFNEIIDRIEVEF